MTEQGFSLSSPAFENGAASPSVHTCDGKNTSPELRWMHVPSEAKSLALIMEDPDAPNGTFTHWVLFNIPASSRGLAQGASDHVAAGKNDFHEDGYGGPCPPPNHGDHRYYFKLYALDLAQLDLENGASRSAVEAAMDGHVVGEAQWMGRFRRGESQ
jgi:Raf kinase inhibitor-like YbhB/YbcL family protein